MRNFTTPMMKQYMKIKSEYQDCLLFFRLGDFYELFLDDAKKGAEVLDITLTSRPRGKDGKIPMAGVPYHAVDNYIAKLVRAGYKVAICEQVSEPDKNGIVDREVIRVVTPGTVLDEKALEQKENNFLICILIEDPYLSVSYADISTGHFETKQIQFDDLNGELLNELSRINPSECILPPHHYNNPDLLRVLKQHKNFNIYCYFDWEDAAIHADKFLKEHFGVHSLEGFDLTDNNLSKITSAVLLHYLKETQMDKIGHIKKITTSTSDKIVSMDRATMINLELFSTIRDHDTRGSFLEVIDKTQTAMGGRMLKTWIKEPLCDKKQINMRHDAVEEFTNNLTERVAFRKILAEVNDIERILSRLSVGIGNPRDMISLKESLIRIIQVKHKLVKSKSSLLQKSQKNISIKINKAIALIDEYIKDEPSVSLKDGGIIKSGIDGKLDNLRNSVTAGKEILVEIETKEKQRTGISNLKVRFNQVFGFYIEVSKSNSHLVPQDFIRKQTLVNAERFITQELKKHEEAILGAEEKIKKLEYDIYQEVLSKLLLYTKDIQKASISISTIDCLLAFAHIAQTNNYKRPKMIYSGEMRIKKSRHPVVENLLEEMQFVPNDVELTNINKHILIITGPNMAGKSVYIRQVALIVLMAQIGSFVPAQAAYISIVDKIFVRSGASDVITSGLSTFMVEMVETAYILNHATHKSLIVMDEIGRGTSTYDGISIAWAVAEYLAKQKKPPKTLFATHYHELQNLENEHPNKIKNFHLSVKEENGEPVFLHTVLPGGASHSFGVAVARLAGVPDEVVSRANEILETLEKKNKIINTSNAKKNSYNKNNKLASEIKNINIDSITPLEALNLLSEIKKHAQNS